MSKNYRQIYEKELNVTLRNHGCSSIHHCDGDHTNDKFSNWVCVPQKWHDEYNLMIKKFPKLLKCLSKNLPKIMKVSMVEDLKLYISLYEELNYWLDVKKSIKMYGIEYTKLWYTRVNELYE